MKIPPFAAQLFCLLVALSACPSPSFSWNVMGKYSVEQAPRIATDSMGNVYCAGAFIGTVDLIQAGSATLTSGFSGLVMIVNIQV